MLFQGKGSVQRSSEQDSLHSPMHEKVKQAFQGNPRKQISVSQYIIVHACNIRNQRGSIFRGPKQGVVCSHVWVGVMRGGARSWETPLKAMWVHLLPPWKAYSRVHAAAIPIRTLLGSYSTSKVSQMRQSRSLIRKKVMLHYGDITGSNKSEDKRTAPDLLFSFSGLGAGFIFHYWLSALWFHVTGLFSYLLFVASFLIHSKREKAWN